MGISVCSAVERAIRISGMTTPHGDYFDLDGTFNSIAA
jgi:hypothetical protein